MNVYVRNLLYDYVMIIVCDIKNLRYVVFSAILCIDYTAQW